MPGWEGVIAAYENTQTVLIPWPPLDAALPNKPASSPSESEVQICLYARYHSSPSSIKGSRFGWSLSAVAHMCYVLNFALLDTITQI